MYMHAVPFGLGDDIKKYADHHSINGVFTIVEM